MYVAKDNKLRYGFYDASVDARAAARLELVGELSRAISEAELVLHYQPKVAVQGRPGGRGRGARAMAGPEPWAGDAGRVHPRCPRDEPHQGRHPVRPRGGGAPVADVVRRGASVAGRRQPDQGGPGRPRLPGRGGDASRELADACQHAPARDHRGLHHRGPSAHRGRHRAPRCHGPEFLDRRFRDGTLLAHVLEAAAGRRDQDRPVVRLGHARPGRGRGHRPFDDRPRPQPRPRGGRRRGGKARHHGPPDRARMRRRPGLLREQAGASRGADCLARPASRRRGGARPRSASSARTPSATSSPQPEGSMGTATISWPSAVRQRPLASSNRQPCMAHSSTPSPTVPKRDRSAFKWGQRRWTM